MSRVEELRDQGLRIYVQWPGELYIGLPGYACFQQLCYQAPYLSPSIRLYAIVLVSIYQK
jgi:hypothetical protein